VSDTNSCMTGAALTKGLWNANCSPSVTFHDRVYRQENTNIGIVDLVFEYDKARRLGTFQPLCVLSNDRLIRILRVIANRPISSILIPHHGFETKDTRCNGSNSVIDITVRRSLIGVAIPSR
jgi:hypothetical protein